MGLDVLRCRTGITRSCGREASGAEEKHWFSESSAVVVGKKKRNKPRPVKRSRFDRECSYLVDPASSHMLVSKIKPCMSKYKHFVLWNCEWLIKSVIVYLIVPIYYLDNRGNSRANTCEKSRLAKEGMYLLDSKPMRVLPGPLVIHNNFANRTASRWRCFIQISALSTVDGKVLAYHGYNGWRRIRVRFRRGSLRDGYHIQGRQQARKLPNPDSGR